MQLSHLVHCVIRIRYGARKTRPHMLEFTRMGGVCGGFGVPRGEGGNCSSMQQIVIRLFKNSKNIFGKVF